MIREQQPKTEEKLKQQASAKNKIEEQNQLQHKEQIKQIPQEQLQPISEQFVEANIELSENSKKEGNQYFKNANYCQAIGKYQQSLRHTPKSELKFRCILYSNMSICFSKLENYKDSIKYCKKALQCDKDYEKVQLNLATSYEKNDNLEQALQEYKKIFAKYPKDMKYALKVSQLQKKIAEKNQKMKKEAIDGLKSIGNSLLGYFGLSLDNFKMEQGENGGYSVSMKK